MRIPPLLLLAAFAIVPAIAAHSAETALVSTPAKCGTPLVLETMRQRGKIAARPSLKKSILSADGHFRVHYDTTGANAPNLADLDLNSIPDYIDSTLVFLEYAWDLEVNKLGYNPPKSDTGAGGGDEIDVYIRELGDGFYGITYPDQIFNGSSSAYMILDNNYTGTQYYSKGLDGMRVTSAHEFFHVIQFGYFLDWDQSWWMEQSATWMEDRAWNGVNDYLNYLVYFFTQSHLPIDTSNGGFEYGAVLWPMYLSKRFGDTIIRNLWETLAAAPDRGISCFDGVIPIGLGNALNEFGVWNFFTYKRANTAEFYSDGDLFEYSVLVELRKYDSTPDSLEMGNLGSGYAEIMFIGDWGARDGLKINFSAETGLTTANSLIFYNSSQDFRIHQLNHSGETLTLGKTWKSAVLVNTCTNTYLTGGPFLFNAEWSDITGVAERTPSVFAVAGARPNPFNPSTTICFTLPRDGKASVTVYNITGQKVADLFNGTLSAGEKTILWKPSGLSGGVYFVSVSSGSETRTAKVLLLK